MSAKSVPKPPARILIAEDSSTQGERLRYLLELHQYQVTWIEDGLAALAWLSQTSPDIVITDINMPRLNGYELCRQIKADKRLQNIPVILLTSLSDATDVLKGLACGADSFITKPYSEDYLIARVEQSLIEAAVPQSSRANIRLEIPLSGQDGVIIADPQRMVSLLLSTYEAAIYRNSELAQAQEELRTLNERLEDLVEERTAVLSAEIVERKRAEAALAHSTELLTQAEMVGQIGSWRWNIVEDKVQWSDGLYRLFGVDAKEFEATNAAYAAYVYPDDRDHVSKMIEGVIDQQGRAEYTYRVARPDGEIRVQSARAEAILDHRGSTVALLGIVLDVTERKQRERVLEAIAAVSVALRTAETQAQMLPIILEQVMGLLGARGAALILHEPSADELVITLGRGEYAAITGMHFPAGNGITGQVLATGRPYISADLSAEVNVYKFDALNLLQAGACMPLVTSSGAVGVMWACRPAPFTDEEASVLSAIAGISASAIERAGLHEQTRERLERLTALREIDRAIMNSMDLRTTLSIIVRQVTAQLGVDASDILLLNQGTKVLEHAAGYGFRTRGMEQVRLRLGEGHAGLAALDRRLVAVPDVRAEPGPFVRAKLLGDSFVALFCMPLIAKGQVVGVLDVWSRTPLDPNDDWLAYLETVAGQSAIAISDALQFTALQRSNQEILVAYDSTLVGWSAALDLRDKETEGHSQRVTEMAVRLARQVGMRNGELEQLRRGALLHDIGKMGVPDSILHKPAPLTDEEWVIMRRHPVLAFELLSPIGFLRTALDIPYCHHEKWDGTGYPRKLEGDAIPLSARIFAVVDVWDALRSDRPYRRGWPEDKVREYLQGQSGHHFDPAIVETFLAMLPVPALETA